MDMLPLVPARRDSHAENHKIPTMPTIFSIFLILHVIGGAVGLLTGFINILRKKGDKKHVFIGKLFIGAMLTAGFSALVLSVLHPNYFLFVVGIFTLYLIGTGNRYIYLKMLDNGQMPQLIDWIITFTMLLAGLLFVSLGIFHLTKSNLFGLVFATFGLFGLLFVRQDFANYRGKSDMKNYWLLAHLQRMTGGFIAALTAFLVVNAQYFPEQIPGFIFWLLPTVFLTPLIVRWSRKLEVKRK